MPDTAETAGTQDSPETPGLRLLISRFQVRVLGGSLSDSVYLSRILLAPDLARDGLVGLYHDFYHDQLKLAPSEGDSEAAEGLPLIARREVAVGVDRGRDRGVAEDLLENLRGLPDSIQSVAKEWRMS
jgi:hypothetical protein